MTDARRAETFLFEVGVEELPVSFLHAALEALPTAVESALRRGRLAHGSVHVFGTPRRIAFRVEAVVARQTAVDEWVTGPPRARAFDASGKPTAAALGFAKKQGIAVDCLVEVEKAGVVYVAAHQQDEGEPAVKVLSSLIPPILSTLPFPKVMRWGDGAQAFGRPVQWLVALWGSDIVPVSFAGVEAGRSTLGHRFMAPRIVPLAHADAYEVALAEANVVASVGARSRLMLERLAYAAERLGGRLEADPFLLRECASLVEQPLVVAGAFDARFLTLPEAVVVSVMRDHQRYFAIRDAETNALRPAYLNVVNTAEHPEGIQRGNDRVLRARLEDAQFFVEEDRKVPLSVRAAALDRITFHRKLGSLGDKARRMETLAVGLVAAREEAAIRKAARLAKADLATLLVGEFPALQGEMGCYYANAEGLDPEVAQALREHMLPKGADEDPRAGLPSGRLGAALAIADRIDTLIGISGIGLKASGSADPYGLRRAALGVLRLALYGPLPKEVDLEALLAAAYDLFPAGVLSPREEVLAETRAYLHARLPQLLAHSPDGCGHRPDTVLACLEAWDGRFLPELAARVEALTRFRNDTAFERLLVAYRRAHNITRDQRKSPTVIDPALLEAGAERVLYEAFLALKGSLAEAAAARAFEKGLSLMVARLGAPIDRFFEEVFVMVEAPRVRENRLALLAAIRDAIAGVAQLERLQLDAEAPSAP